MKNSIEVGPEGGSRAEPSTKPPHRAGAVLTVVPRAAPAAGVPATATRLEDALAAARPRLIAVALRMTRNPDDAEDVVQDAMLKMWRGFTRFEGRAALSTWMHRIVVNAALDRLRAQGPVGAPAPRDEGAGADLDTAPDAAGRGASVDTPEEMVGSAEVGAEVRRALASLPPAHRQILALRELDGESYQSIADIVRCPIGTVMSRLHHARHRFAATIAENHRELLPQAA